MDEGVPSLNADQFAERVTAAYAGVKSPARQATAIAALEDLRLGISDLLLAVSSSPIEGEGPSTDA